MNRNQAGWGKAGIGAIALSYLEQPAIDEIAHSLGIETMPYFTRNLLPDCDLITGFLSLHHALQQGCDTLRERELLLTTFGTL